MRKTKSIYFILLCFALVMTMGTTAFAAGITIDERLEGHTFAAYQIFAGKETKTDNQLVDMKWGTDINASAFLTALKEDEKIGNKFTEITYNTAKADNSAIAVAKALESLSAEEAAVAAKIAYANKSGEGTAVKAGDNNLPSGYYLIVDTTEFAEGAEDTFYNAALLQVTGNVSVQFKTDRPSVEKKVKENTDYKQNDGYGTGYNDTADYSIGDSVPFELIGFVPDMTNYDTYKYIFHDTLSESLTPPAKDSIKVYAAEKKDGTDNDGSDGVDITSHFAITISGQNITAGCNDIKAISGVSHGKYIVVKYEAVLNKSAFVGQENPGNTNEVYLEYSNHPNEDKTGVTKKDVVIVFTYGLKVNKIDGKDAGKKLEDAQFLLKSSDGTKYAQAAENRLTGWTTERKEAAVLKSGTDGQFQIAGLDAGRYRLEETKAPEGYNLLKEDIFVTITADTSNGQQGKGAVTELSSFGVASSAGEEGESVNGNGDKEAGMAEIDVANNSGVILPETGGRGTKAFYIIGGLLIAGSAILLITKKRMSKSER